MRNSIRLVMSSLLVLLVACDAVTDTISDDDFGHRPQALSTQNSIAGNALDLNALNLNTLNRYPLRPEALEPAALAAIQNPGPDGVLARQFVEYAASCALAPSQAFSFSWTDSAGVSHNESYPGHLGLATYWARGSLTASDERWISACLAARVNWYGVHVTISTRSAGTRLPVSDPERATFTLQEGAFFGNLFGTTQAIYSCDDPTHANPARARYRDCAVGHLNDNGSISNCGIIQRLGSCSSWCADPDPTDGYYPNCDDPQGNERKEVVTVFLQ